MRKLIEILIYLILVLTVTGIIPVLVLYISYKFPLIFITELIIVILIIIKNILE